MINFNWLYRFLVSLKLAYDTFLLKISDGRISFDDTRDLLKEYAFVGNIRISDNFFTLANKDNMVKLVSLSPVRFRRYQKEIYDCDDFSFTFMGLYRFLIPNFAVGIIWSRTHAYNFFIDSDRNVWGVEPQSNKVFRIVDKKEDIQLMII